MDNRGIQCLIELVDGQIDLLKTRSLFSFHQKKKYDIFEVGILTPEGRPTGYLGTGQVGYFLSNMKSVSEAHIGDTFFCDVSRQDIEPFDGYKPPQNMVFAGVYPLDPDNYDEL